MLFDELIKNQLEDSYPASSSVPPLPLILPYKWSQSQIVFPLTDTDSARHCLSSSAPPDWDSPQPLNGFIFQFKFSGLFGVVYSVFKFWICLQSFSNVSAEFFQYPCIWGLCPPPIFSCKKFRFEPLILKQNIYPRPTHHTSLMYDTIREENDHIVKIYISFVLNVAAGLTKMCPQQNVYAGAFGSRVRTEYTTPLRI